MTAKKTDVNRAKKSELNTYIKKYKAKPSKDLLAQVTSLLDKAAQDNLIHVNKANRIKAKLAALCA